MFDCDVVIHQSSASDLEDPEGPDLIGTSEEYRCR